MATPTFPSLEAYRRAVFVQEDELLANLMPRAIEQGVPKISVNPESGKTLNLLAQIVGAQKILEFGCLAGYSGIWLARALPPGGKLISLDISEKHAAIARKNFEAAGLKDKVEVRVGKATDLLPGVASAGPFDLVFIDADKGGYPQYLDFALQHTRKGGLIIADNADAHGQAHQQIPATDDASAIQVYNQRVTNDPQLVSMLIPYGGWLNVALVK